jgi:glutaredoxin
MMIMMLDKIEIYGRKDCTYCDKAKQLCESSNMPYDYYEVGTASAEGDVTVEKFQELFPHSRTIPQIRINGTHIGGFKELQAELKY